MEDISIENENERLKRQVKDLEEEVKKLRSRTVIIAILSFALGRML